MDCVILSRGTEGRYEELYVRTLALQPKTDARRTLQPQALKIVGETGQSGERPFGETPISVRAFGALSKRSGEESVKPRGTSRGPQPRLTHQQSRKPVT
jgi:hypothetical protein